MNSWIVYSREKAEQAGADPEYSEVIFAITTGSIADAYNWRQNHDGDEEIDHWENLTKETREEILENAAVWLSQELSDWEERLTDLCAEFSPQPEGSDSGPSLVNGR